MPEIKIYFTEDFHTEHLQEASRDLIMKNFQVIDKCVENLQLLSPKLDSEVVHTRVKQYIDPFYVPARIHSEWNKKENWVSRMLVKAKALSYPEHVDSKLGEHLQSIDQFFAVDAALGFFYTAESRLKALLTMKAPHQLSFTGYGAYAYVESRILRKAIFNGVYLTSPKPKIVVTPFNLSAN